MGQYLKDYIIIKAYNAHFIMKTFLSSFVFVFLRRGYMYTVCAERQYSV